MDRVDELRRVRIKSLTLCIGVLLAVASLAFVAPVFGAGNTIKVSPATTTISPAGSIGGTFTVNVTANATVEMEGAGAALAFDRTRLKLTAVAMDATEVANGVGYAGFPSSSAMAAFMTSANAAGQIPTIAWSYVDGSSAAPTVFSQAAMAWNCPTSSRPLSSGESRRA